MVFFYLHAQRAELPVYDLNLGPLAHNINKQILFRTVIRICINGNPRLYGGWLNETLNMMLRTVGRFAHRNRLEIRVFTLFDLQGRLGLTEEFFGADEVDAG